jgi:Family of unknown function (DUF5399)
MPPRTIDNYPIEVSTRYAEDQKILDKAITEEASRIPARTKIEVTQPVFPSELEMLVGMQTREHTIALFSPPELFFSQRKPLFTSQVCPSLGSEEIKEATMEKIQRIQDEEKTEKQKKSLFTLLETLNLLDKMIIYVNNERTRTQKG